MNAALKSLTTASCVYKKAADQINGERPVTFASAHLRLLKALDRAQEPLPKEALEDAFNARWSEFRKKAFGDTAGCGRPQREAVRLTADQSD